MTIDEDQEPAALIAQRPPRVWKFVGTSLWGMFIFAAMFAGQLAVVLYVVFAKGGGNFDITALKTMLASGVTISLSVIMGLPAVLVTIWIATRIARQPFGDYLALRSASMRNYLIGIGSLILLVGAWDLVSRGIGREAAPGFMLEVLKSARADGALWLLVIAFCVVAPVTEEFFARGFSVSRMVGIIPATDWRHRAVIGGVDRDAPSIRLVFLRRDILDWFAARLSAQTQQLNLAYNCRPRRQQPCSDSAKPLDGRFLIQSHLEKEFIIFQNRNLKNYII